MDRIKLFLNENNGYLDSELLRKNPLMYKCIYERLQIQHNQTPFDYIETLSLDTNGLVHAGIFVEPVGTVGFIATS